MVSNACKIMNSQEKKEEIMNYALIVFLKVGDSFQMNLENFKIIVHLYCICICNGFGIADDQMLRIGMGLYYPSVRYICVLTSRIS
jgi:hypothetical protein